MANLDFNLLVTLEALLVEGSVARAAHRLHLSASAMSRALARLREATGDPLLVRAGRNLVPTPRALELRERVSLLVQEATSVLRPMEGLDLKRLVRTFTLRSRDGFVENFGPALLARVAEQAPGVRLHFVPKPDRDSSRLREGSVDLETGVVGPSIGPEVRSQALFRDRFIGVVRRSHPLSEGGITPARFGAYPHILVTRRGPEGGPVEEAFERFGLEWKIATLVSTFSEALALARGTDLVVAVPERHTGNLRDGMFHFPLPIPVPEFTISLLWHPRMDADPAHRWLRSCVREVCADPPVR